MKSLLTLALTLSLLLVPATLCAQDSPAPGSATPGASQSQSETPSTGTQMSTQSGAETGGNDSPLSPDLPVTTDAAVLYPAAANQVVQPGDLLNIFIYGEPQLVPSIRVGPNGDVDLPFLHKLHIEGLTTTQAQELIAAKLKEAQIYTHPQVVVTITESFGTNVNLIGELRAHVPVYGERRLIDVIAAAGGLPATASHTVLISRRGLAQPIVVDLGLNPVLSPGGQTIILPGDVISFQRVGMVYVLGQFKTDGVYPLSGNESTTLIQLAAKLGDPNFAAKPHELRLIRTTNGQRHFVVIDYKRIVEGKDPDPILQGGDILYMPTNQFKAALNSGGLSAALQVVNLALLAFSISRY